MKEIIRRVLKEETNETIKVINKYYDVEATHVETTHRKLGNFVFKTFVRFTPKDSENDMTPYVAKSWAILLVKKFGDGTYDFDFYDCTYVRSTEIPLLDYIGGTYDLDNYVEDLHRKEVERAVSMYGL